MSKQVMEKRSAQIKEGRYQLINSTMCRLERSINGLTDCIGELKGLKVDPIRPEYPASSFKDVYDSLITRASTMADTVDSIIDEINNLLLS